MRRCLGKACAGILMLAAAGCTIDSFLNRQIEEWGPTVFVPGTIAEVATKLRDGLSEEGMLVRTNRTGVEFRIASLWKSSTAFCLHLKQVNDADGTKTRVRIHWDKGGNKELWQLILKILNTTSDDGSASRASELSSSP